MSVYSLWDNETNNLVAEYPNRRDALAQVLRAIERNGVQDVESLSLDVEDDRGQVTTIASGRELAALAHREMLPMRLAG